jgi:bifunctional UDP-N-acetylglucosamine pyrophosphorylase/glucosamine-1-phosphate N-acetyltransferase
MKISAAILAAGQGTRMKSATPKVLHSLAGKKMIEYSLETAKSVCTELPVVIIGHHGDEVMRQVDGRAQCVVQEPQRGTAHALLQAEKALAGHADTVLVFYADMPLLRSETLKRLVDEWKKERCAIALLTITVDDPRGFGRILRDPSGRITAIVEEAQATPIQKNIRELNAGVYCFDNKWLWQALHRIKASPKGEYYLTDVVEIASQDGLHVKAIPLEDAEEGIGINTRVHLAEAELTLRRRKNRELMESGVTMTDPDHTYIEQQVRIGKDTIVQPNTFLRGETEIGEGCEIGPNTIMEDTKVGNHCRILCALLEGAILEDHVSMGPYAHLRKGAHLGRGVHMGNFGEVKNSYLGAETKMGHFSYIGDATIGENVNIGAGTVTCNYDGEQKNKTVIEEDVFIGSDTMLVAPVKIGKGAKTGAGAVVTHDVEAGTVVVGVPAHPIKKDVKDKDHGSKR